MICQMLLKRRRWRVLAGLSVVLILFLVVFRHPTEQDDVMIPLKSKHENQEEYIDKSGIHVVVGHYMGDSIPGKTTPNLSQEILNINGYNPQPGAGEMGLPVLIPAWQSSKMQQLYHVNKFNLIASDKISVNRSLPDVRKKECSSKGYNTGNLPTTSVIIVFHNEAWSTLLRTVHSVINRSPQHLLKEILLVDDASERTFLKGELDKEVAQLSVPVDIVRVPSRVGLIRSRLLGAKSATGDVLTFLDAHCEVTTGWLEPLLHHIAEDNHRVVCPVIDIINDDTFQYVRSLDLHWGAFNWNLHFRWLSIGRKEIKHQSKRLTDPYMTPAMAGGLFSIHREYFFNLGSYDDHMEIWGGENLEMSFRVWMCGGSINIVPCSHVGHVFRKNSPYSFPGEGGVSGILHRNLARVALVWLDEWTPFYFLMNQEAAKVRLEVDVTERLKLRKKLGCKSFQWYLNNIWPQNFYPTKDGFFGKIRHNGKSKCIQRPHGSGGMGQPTGPVVLQKCAIETYPQQSFVFNKKGYIMTDESVCLDAPDADNSKEAQVRMMACMELERQRWTYDEKSKQLKHLQSGMCLDLPSDSHPETLSLKQCSSSASWTFLHQDWSSSSI